MKKDAGIIKVVQHLQSKFGEMEILIQDHWDADLMAIGLTDRLGKYLISISTFDLQPERFYVALEITTTEVDNPYENAGEMSNISLEELELIAAQHLQINKKQQL